MRKCNTNAAFVSNEKFGTAARHCQFHSRARLLRISLHRRGKPCAVELDRTERRAEGQKRRELEFQRLAFIVNGERNAAGCAAENKRQRRSPHANVADLHVIPLVRKGRRENEAMRERISLEAEEPVNRGRNKAGGRPRLLGVRIRPEGQRWRRREPRGDGLGRRVLQRSAAIARFQTPRPGDDVPERSSSCGRGNRPDTAFGIRLGIVLRRSGRKTAHTPVG